MLGIARTFLIFCLPFVSARSRFLVKSPSESSSSSYAEKAIGKSSFTSTSSSTPSVNAGRLKIICAYQDQAENLNATSSLGGLFNTSEPKKYSLFSNIFRLRFVTTLIKKFLQIFIADPDVLSIVSRLFSWIIWSYVALSIIGTCGIDTKPILSLLSISGLTLGFAAKDILTNTYAGAYIMIMRPFKRGMTISVDSVRGKVISIDTNYVQLLGKDNVKFLIPSHTVYGKAIIIESSTASP